MLNSGQYAWTRYSGEENFECGRLPKVSAQELYALRSPERVVREKIAHERRILESAKTRAKAEPEARERAEEARKTANTKAERYKKRLKMRRVTES